MVTAATSSPLFVEQTSEVQSFITIRARACELVSQGKAADAIALTNSLENKDRRSLLQSDVAMALARYYMWDSAFELIVSIDPEYSGDANEPAGTLGLYMAQRGEKEKLLTFINTLHDMLQNERDVRRQVLLGSVREFLRSHYYGLV